MLHLGRLHSKVIRESVGENMPNFHFCARRGWDGPAPGGRGCQGLKVVTLGDSPEHWLCNCRDLASSGRRVSVSRSLEEAHGPVPLAWLSCPPPLGSFQRLLGPVILSILQETSPSWLLSAGLHLHERGGVGSLSGPAVWTTSTRQGGAGQLCLKHCRNQGP